MWNRVCFLTRPWLRRQTLENALVLAILNTVWKEKPTSEADNAKPCGTPANSKSGCLHNDSSVMEQKLCTSRRGRLLRRGHQVSGPLGTDLYSQAYQPKETLPVSVSWVKRWAWDTEPEKLPSRESTGLVEPEAWTEVQIVVNYYPTSGRNCLSLPTEQE